MRKELVKLQATLRKMGKDHQAKEVGSLIKSADLIPGGAAQYIPEAVRGSFIQRDPDTDTQEWDSQDNRNIFYYIKVDNKRDPRRYTLMKLNKSNRFGQALLQGFPIISALMAGQATASMGEGLGRGFTGALEDVARERGYLGSSNRILSGSSAFLGKAISALLGGSAGYAGAIEAERFLGFGQGKPVIEVVWDYSTKAYQISGSTQYTQEIENILIRGMETLTGIDSQIVYHFKNILDKSQPIDDYEYEDEYEDEYEEEEPPVPAGRPTAPATPAGSADEDVEDEEYEDEEEA
jgi:hypothetical protein